MKNDIMKAGIGRLLKTYHFTLLVTHHPSSDSGIEFRTIRSDE